MITAARPGAGRAAADLGRGQAKLHLALPGAAARGGHARRSWTGLVAGLPAALAEQILARSEGVPLYAVETVRMLLDRGLLVQEGSVYRAAGPIETLEVPETLHALIAARLDGLTADERHVVQNGAVLGKTFTRAAVAALTGDGGRAPGAGADRRSCARRCCRCRPTRARPSTASTGSCRT